MCPMRWPQEAQLELPLTMAVWSTGCPNTLDGAAISNENLPGIRAPSGHHLTVNMGLFEDAMSAVLAGGRDLCASASPGPYCHHLPVRLHRGGTAGTGGGVRSLGQGFLAVSLTARKKLREAPTMDELGDWVEANKLHICHWFTVNDLNYLKKGGRVSAATAFVGTMLSIKPIMHTSDEGKLTVMLGKPSTRAA